MIPWNTDSAPVLVGNGVARFRDPADADRPTAPSFALMREPAPTGPLPPDFPLRAEFRTRPSAREVRIPIPPGTSLYGTGEVAGPLRRNGRRTVCWNTDAFRYDEATTPLYQSHPWVLALRPDGSAFGVLFDTIARCEINPDTDAEPGAIHAAIDPEAPPFAVYVIDRPTPQQVLSTLADLTGHAPLPPRWALGYHQCRWSYEPASRVVRLAEDFRRRRIPCDCIWLDIDYMDGFRCFTFDPEKFPDPVRLNETLHQLGFKSVWMIDPGIKVDPEYPIYQQGNAGGYFLQNANGGEYHGSVWPGPCAFPDFTMESTRRWWAGLYADFLATGIDGVWNDMNEPAIFDNPEKQMPVDNWHRADEALGGPGPHRRYHNAYGLLMVRASREGIAAARPDKRPFVLTRSNFLGGHRYAATWTGDNQSTWDHLAWSIPMILNLGLSAQPFAGPDIGGFYGNATPELFARWMGIGALLPFARGHTIKDSADHEPWSFGPECEATCRLALERRYRLLPYLYTLFWEASRTGLPVARPLFFADPADPNLRAIDDAFLLGADLLVRAAVSESSNQPASPLPRGMWRAWDPAPRPDGSSDPDLPELRFRGGSIVPLGPIVQYADERPLDPLTLVVTPDADGNASGILYEDAGDGHDHLQGVYRLSTYRAHREGDDLVITLAQRDARLDERHDRPGHSSGRGVEVIVLTEHGPRTARGRDGEAIRVRL